MDDQERRRKLKEQTTEFYAAVGRFGVKFELLCLALKLGILTILENHGLKTQQLVFGLLGEIHARQLKDIYEKMIRKSREKQLTIGDGWLGSLDSNQDSMIQSHVLFSPASLSLASSTSSSRSF